MSSKISNAFHALAVDEKRKNFEATLWHQQPDSKNQVLKQVWFPGVHSDVGGGYPESESGLSDLALNWMLEKARGCNLNFDNVAMNPNPMAPMHESYRGFYKLQSRLFREMARKEQKKGNSNESLHPSLIIRYKEDEKYRPKNLVDFFDVILCKNNSSANMSDKTPDPVKGFGKFKYKVELFIWLIGIVTLVGKLYRLLLPQNINISLTALSPVFA